MFPGCILLYKVNNKNTRAIKKSLCKVKNKDTTTSLKWFWCDFFSLNRFYTFFWCVHCWIWTSCFRRRLDQMHSLCNTFCWLIWQLLLLHLILDRVWKLPVTVVDRNIYLPHQSLEPFLVLINILNANCRCQQLLICGEKHSVSCLL